MKVQLWDDEDGIIHAAIWRIYSNGPIVLCSGYGPVHTGHSKTRAVGAPNCLKCALLRYE